MDSFEQKRLELIRLIPEGIDPVLEGLKELAPEDSDAYREALLIEGRWQELQKRSGRGVVSEEQKDLQTNQIRESLLAVINAMDPQGRLPAEAREQKKRNFLLIAALILLGLLAGYFILYFTGVFGPGEALPNSGKILYAIPAKMQVQEKHECRIRISPETLPESELEAGIDTKDSIRTERIRIGETMTAELVDPGPEKHFEIFEKSSLEQIVEPDEYTEWRFDVMPLKEGTHVLNLKVSIIVLLEGNREKPKDVLVLDREIEIISEKPGEEEVEFQEAKTLLFAEASEQVSEDVNPVTDPGEDPDKIRNGGDREPVDKEPLEILTDNIVHSGFPSGSDAFLPSSELQAYLREISNLLNRDSSRNLLITGHTDHIGTEAYNDSLAIRRARSARQYLQDKLGVNRGISVAGRGEREPVASNKTREGRANNRRVEFRVLTKD